MPFQINAYFNPYLPAGQRRLDAVLTVSSTMQAGGSATAGGRKMYVFVLDISGSMDGEKLIQAKNAARRGIEMLGPNDWVSVVVFNGAGQTLVRACQASDGNKAEAHRLVQSLKAAGSTKMSRALQHVLAQVRGVGDCIASVYFLTDGGNDTDDGEALSAAIDQCKGVFQCSCRGVGTAWKPDELRRISNALLGTADAIPDPAALERDLQAFITGSMSKSVAGATLRLWSPKAVKVTMVRQMSPEILDLIPLARRLDEKTLDLPLGAWGVEARDYQLAFDMQDGAVGEEILACRASVITQGLTGEVKVACDPIAATWSADDALTTRISREVAHYTGQTELANSIQEGLDAKSRGDEDAATRLLGRAAQLAAASGNDEVTRRLKKVVDVLDASAGTVRLRKSDKGAEMELDMGATRTVRRRAAPTAQQP